MSGFFYFSESDIKSAPEFLAYHFDDQNQAHTREMSKGPSGGAGTLITSTVGVPDLDDANWWQIPYRGNAGAAGLWVGFSGAPPKPTDLARPACPVKSIPVTLADGNEWLVPVARAWFLNAEHELRWCPVLPTARGMDENGKWLPPGMGPPLATYKYLWPIAEKLANLVFDASNDEGFGISFEHPELNDWACTLLGVNYRVSFPEIVVAGLLDDYSIGEIVAAFLDIHGLIKKKRESIAKRSLKTDSEETSQTNSTTRAGEPDSTQAICQA